MMKDNNYISFIEKSINQRLENLSVLNIFKNLSNVHFIDNRKAISLGMAVLDFILEEMLKGKKGAKYTEVNNFLCDLDKEIDSEKANKIITLLIYEENLKGITYEYYDYNTNEIKTIRTAFVDTYIDYSGEGQTTYLKLTSAGKDFMFRTLEIYTELQITMELLFLKEQIKRGAFSEAIQSAENLRLSVAGRLEDTESLIHEIKRAPWRINSQKFIKVYDSNREQFESEKHHFSEIYYLIHEAGNNYKEEEEKVKKQIIYLEEIIYDSREKHELLFIKYQELLPNILNARTDTLFSFIEGKINFDTDFVDNILRTDEEKVSEKVLYPFINYFPKKLINIQALIESNNITVKKSKEKQILPVEEIEKANKSREIIEEKKFDFLCKLFSLAGNEPVKLNQIVENPDFIILNYVLELHQQKFINFFNSTEIIRKIVKKQKNFTYTGFTVSALDEVLYIENMEYTNFQFVFIR